MPYYGYSNPNVFGDDAKKKKKWDYSFDLNAQNDQSLNPYQAPPPPPQNTEPDFAQAYVEMLKNEGNGPSTKAYGKYLQEGEPIEPKTTKKGLIGAMLAGGVSSYFNGPKYGNEVSENLLHGNYNDDLEKHRRQGLYLKEAQSIEEKGYGKQLAITKAMLDAAQKKRDDVRLEGDAADRQKTNELRRESLRLDLSTKGYQEVHSDDGHLYMVNKNDPSDRRDLGKYNESTQEKANRTVSTSVRTAEGVTPIQQRSRLFLQDDAQRHADEQQQRGFAHTDKTTADKATGAGRSVTQIDTRNAIKVQAITEGNPERYKNVYVKDPVSGRMGVNNPLAATGIPRTADNKIDWNSPILTPKAIDEYNAFVELHNANLEGFPELQNQRMMPLTKYKPLTGGR